MRALAVVTAVNLAAITAATFILHEPRPRDEVIEQVQREQQQLLRHVERMEKTLAVALNRNTAGASVESRASTAALQSHAPESANAAAALPTPERQANHDELLQSGNALVDRILSGGVVRMSDFGKVMSATRGLSAEERMQIVSRLHAAMNANQVSLERAGTRRTP